LQKKYYHKINKILNNIIPRTNLYCLGDSHTEVFEYIKSNFLFSSFCIKTIIVQGATVSGFSNPNSKTQSMFKFENHINNCITPNDVILFELGEVDCGFVLWYKSQIGSCSINFSLNKAISNYEKLIDNAINKVGKKVIIMSAILPTIADGVNFGNIANKRSKIKATQSERTELTLRFNREMEIIASKKGVLYLNLDHILIDKKSKLIKSKFLNKNPENHHCDNHKLSLVLIKELKRIKNELPHRKRIGYRILLN